MEKLCINCNRYLDESMFPLRKRGKTSNVCSECEAKRKKEWYEKNREKIREQRKQKSSALLYISWWYSSIADTGIKVCLSDMSMLYSDPSYSRTHPPLLL